VATTRGEAVRSALCSVVLGSPETDPTPQGRISERNRPIATILCPLRGLAASSRACNVTKPWAVRAQCLFVECVSTGDDLVV
jgi:hypothetical protein